MDFVAIREQDDDDPDNNDADDDNEEDTPSAEAVLLGEMIFRFVAF